MGVVRKVVGRRRQQAIGLQTDAPRTQRPHVQPDGRRTRAAVEGKGQRTLFRVLAVERVGNKKHLGFDLAVAAFEREPARGRGVLERLAIQCHLVVGHHRRNFGDIKLFFVLVGTWLRAGRLLLFGRIGFRGFLCWLLFLTLGGCFRVLRLLSFGFVSGRVGLLGNGSGKQSAQQGTRHNKDTHV